MSLLPPRRTRPSASRRRGRPRGVPAAAARDRILDAGRQVLAERGYPAATLREIAARADVTPALVHYYFGSKRGLHAAVLERVATTLRERVTALSTGGGSSPERLRALVRAWVRLLAEDPYVPRMIVEEILWGDEERLEEFAARFSAPIAERVLGFVAEGIRSGELRRIELPFVLPSLAGLVVFFFLGAPLLRRVVGIDPNDPEVAEAWAEHAAGVLLNGIAAPGAQR